uniref:Uncharacterized protein n=1 Tax=Ananas comosus var. bracteatus TaxID=296719 RepID=A0A6V7Q525_ANACO|nr:unnamed protein product [Ananas comosus var. bracteatus]
MHAGSLPEETLTPSSSGGGCGGLRRPPPNVPYHSDTFATAVGAAARAAGAAGAAARAASRSRATSARRAAATGPRAAPSETSPSAAVAAEQAPPPTAPLRRQKPSNHHPHHAAAAAATSFGLHLSFSPPLPTTITTCHNLNFFNHKYNSLLDSQFYTYGNNNSSSSGNRILMEDPGNTIAETKPTTAETRDLPLLEWQEQCCADIVGREAPCAGLGLWAAAGMIGGGHHGRSPAL